jgi:CRISPR-associated protein Cas1
VKQHLNTLYVTTQGTYLAKDGETVAVRVEGRTRLRVPIHNLGGIVCFGNVGCSPFLMGLCGQRQVGLSFLTENGRFLARVQGQVSGNVLLRREQYRRADSPAASAAIVRPMLTAKLANSRSLLRRSLRAPTLAGKEKVEKAHALIGQHLDGLSKALEVDTMRGFEGSAAREYFSVFDNLLLKQRDDFPFEARSRRPPLNRLNALLSFLYTLLRHDVESALEGVGLDPAVGYLHRDRPGRPSLALDLMEELRPVLAERLALTLINRKQILAKGFEKKESGAVWMDDATRKKVLQAYQKRKQDELQHPFLGEKTTLGLVPHVQALLLARHLRGDLDSYPPFLGK